MDIYFMHGNAMSVFKNFNNAVIKVGVITGYSDDGFNAAPTTSLATLPAMLRPREKSAAITLTERVGVNVNEVDFIGYLLHDPPVGLKAPCECTVEFTTGQTFRLMLHLPPPNPFYNQVGVLGTPVLLVN